MSFKPFEFIDCSNLNNIPYKSKRSLQDPLAFDIKIEPEIKEEPDVEKDTTFSDYASFSNPLCKIKEEPLDQEDVSDGEISRPVKPHSINEVEGFITTENHILTNESILNKEYESMVQQRLCDMINVSSHDYIRQFHNYHKFEGSNLLRENAVEETVCFERSLVSHHKRTSYKRKRTEPPQEFFCHHCGYITRQKGHIRSHVIAMHGGHRPFSCRQCKLKFVQKGNLNRHNMAVHKGEKPHKCEHCEFTCSRKEGLRRHFMSVHASDKPFTCSLCEYKTIRRYRLLHHIKLVHKHIRPFSCTFCNYSTCKKPLLLDHYSKKHKGFKPFLLKKINLKIDTVIEKCEESYICVHCSYYTNYKNVLRNHMKNSHLSKE